MRLLRNLPTLAAVEVLAFTALAFVGCDNRKELIDIDTPAGGVEVEQDRDTGAVNVDVDHNE